MLRPAAVLLVLACALAGCSDEPGPAAAAAGPELYLEGVVVSPAIVPVPGANVTAEPGGVAGLTDDGGVFRLGPVAAGAYQVTVRADGYAPVTTTMQVPGPGELGRFVLTATSTSVPYIEVLKWDGYLFCTMDQNIAGYQIVGAPCLGVIDLVTGQQVSQDSWQFQFRVDSPGLAGVQAEMVWDEQPTGKNMGMLLRNVAGAGSGVDAGGTNIDIQYASGEGPSPLQLRVVQGIENPGADDGAAFHVPQDEPKDYKLLILGRADDSQPVDLHIMLQNRPQVFLTKFFNAMGDPSYSVLDGMA